MKHFLAVVLLFALAPAAFSQVFQPVPEPGTSESGSGSNSQIAITAQGADFQFDHTKLTGIGYARISPLAEIDATVDKRVDIGGWLAQDRQKLTDAHLTSTWAEGHCSYLALTHGATTLGVTAGLLALRLQDSAGADNGTWLETGLVGSIALASRRGSANVPEVGFNFCEDEHQDKHEGNAASYGASLVIPMSSRWSANLSCWEIAVHDASTIRIAGIGIGCRL